MEYEKQPHVLVGRGWSTGFSYLRLDDSAPEENSDATSDAMEHRQHAKNKADATSLVAYDHEIGMANGERNVALSISGGPPKEWPPIHILSYAGDNKRQMARIGGIDGTGISSKAAKAPDLYGIMSNGFGIFLFVYEDHPLFRVDLGHF